jgi:hypothetical protein
VPLNTSALADQIGAAAALMPLYSRSDLTPSFPLQARFESGRLEGRTR